MTLHGANELRNRLNAIRGTGQALAQDWADQSEDGIRSEIVRRTGQTAASVHSEVDAGGARVVGSPVVIFLARGTQAHEERPRNARAMRFQIGGRTIFTKRVQHPPTRGNPRILQAAADAINGMASVVYRLWNGAG